MAAHQRVMLAYGDCAEAETLKLTNPQTGKASDYILRGEHLLEINLVKDQYTSWLAGESIIEDGSLYLSTPVDPLFMLLPTLQRTRNETAEKPQGQFRPLEDILYEQAGLEALKDLAKKHCPLICEVKGGGEYVRLCDKRTLAWLLCKVQRLKKQLQSITVYSNMDDSALGAYAVDLLGEYLAPDWVKRVRDKLNLTASVSAAQSQGAVAQDEYAPLTHNTGSRGLPSTAPVPVDDRQNAGVKRPPPVAVAKPLSRAQEVKKSKIAKEAKGMKTMASFFTKK
ncbi:hypothetical protein CYMTET_38802 [Cymbomonas tetramitiformis]|uniref:Ribonuclease H2 subunit B n=1 Tax=Cymbomonas tetramitiformis TaxID=36881 RepID=A0AAE0CDD6_9CHLO|nr:hypothetical protein CYMTET_38802 [Cymbomonas tetramitiformis]